MESVYHPAKAALNIIWNVQTTTTTTQLHQIQLDWVGKEKPMGIWNSGGLVWSQYLNKSRIF